MAPVNLSAVLRPATPNIVLPLEHFESGDYFQQILSIDSTLEALNMSKNSLTHKLQAWVHSKGLDRPRPPKQLWYSFSTRSETVRPVPFDLGHLMEYGVKSLDAEAAAEYRSMRHSIKDIAVLVKTFEGLQAGARHCHELRARSLRRAKPSIMSLPNEILFIIFNNIRRPLDDQAFVLPRSDCLKDRKAETRNIKNIRLTCHRFCDIASDLLVRHLHISFQDSSLHRLEGIARNQKIAKGVQILDIDLRYYSATLAQDFQAFSAMCYQKLRDRTKLLERGVRYNADQSDVDSEYDFYIDMCEVDSLEEGEAILSQTHRILSSWESFKNGSPVDDSANFNTAVLALRNGHERYKKLFQQQQDFLQNGRLARTIATVAAASKSKKVWLRMSENYSNPWDRCLDDKGQVYDDYEAEDSALIADPESLIESVMVQPHRWWYAESDKALEIPQSLLYEIPLAIHSVNARLAGLKVDINYPGRLNLNMSGDQMLDFEDVTKDMESFAFCMEQHFEPNLFPQPELEVMEDLYYYLRAAIGPQTRDLSLTLRPLSSRGPADQLLDREESFLLPIQPLLPFSDWRGLKKIKMEAFGVDLDDLRDLANMLKPGTFLDLKSIELTLGTWSAALDCLRSTLGRWARVRLPQGAECEGMTEDEYLVVFGEAVHDMTEAEWFECLEGKFNTSTHVGKATQYIASIGGVSNPLLEFDGATEIEANERLLL